jgi:hypothetical protein
VVATVELEVVAAVELDVAAVELEVPFEEEVPFGKQKSRVVKEPPEQVQPTST